MTTRALEHVFGKCLSNTIYVTKEVTDTKLQTFFIQTTLTTSPVL